jgi:hypothetical protein
LPVEEHTDINLGISEKTFDELDRAAVKAEKSLKKRNKQLKDTITSGTKAEREQKRLTGRGGIFESGERQTIPSGSHAPRDLEQLTRQDEKIEKKFNKLKKNLDLDIVNQNDVKSSFLGKTLGSRTASNIFSVGKNPVGFLTKNLKFVPILGVVIAAKEIAEFIVNELVKLDKFLKVFIDQVDNRMDAFRTLQQQADIQAGITQRIITTASGGVEPRYTYNTFDEFNNNRSELEQKFQMNNSGVD